MLAEPALSPAPGRGLLRGSIGSWVVDEVGVAWAEPAGECVPEPPCEGDAVPVWSFFFEDDFESWARSLSDWQRETSAGADGSERGATREGRWNWQLTTL